MRSNNPDISIDEALNLFLAVTYPRGIPEGVDKEEFLRILREKIARDRPDWAKTGENQSQVESFPKERQSYSRVKEEIAHQAQQEEVPEDPEERYFYQRHQEAARNREQKKEEERENQIREDLCKRFTAQKQEADKETLEKALLIRKVLEQRIKSVLTTQSPGEKNLTIQPPGFLEHEPSKDKVPKRAYTSNLDFGSPAYECKKETHRDIEQERVGKSLEQALETRLIEEKPLTSLNPSNKKMKPSHLQDLTSLQDHLSSRSSKSSLGRDPAYPELRTGKEGSREFFNNLKDLEPKEQVRILQEWNRERRSKLKSKEDVLCSRRPSEKSKRDGLLSIDMDKKAKKENETDELMSLSMEAENAKTLSCDLAFSVKSRPHGLTLE